MGEKGWKEVEEAFENLNQNVFTDLCLNYFYQNVFTDLCLKNCIKMFLQISVSIIFIKMCLQICVSKIVSKCFYRSLSQLFLSKCVYRSVSQKLYQNVFTDPCLKILIKMCLQICVRKFRSEFSFYLLFPDRSESNIV